MSSNTDGNPPLQASLTHGMRDCKRYISGHDGDKSVFLESPELLYTDAGGAYAVARSFALERVPAPLTGDQDLENYLSKDGETKVTSYVNSSITIPDGVNIIVVNFAPGGKSAMHRTVSVDFVVCVDGEIECELDNGDKRTLRLGDTIIQRATMHRWTNPSKEKGARVIAVTVSSDRINVGGKGIEETFLTE